MDVVPAGYSVARRCKTELMNESLMKSPKGKQEWLTMCGMGL